MEEKYRSLFELSDEDFEKAVAKLAPEKLDVRTVLNFLNYHNIDYVRKVHLIFTVCFPNLHPLNIDFALLTSKAHEDQENAKSRLATYPKDYFDFQELRILRNSDNADVSDAANSLMHKHFSQEWKMTGKIEQVVSLFV